MKLFMKLLTISLFIGAGFLLSQGALEAGTLAALTAGYTYTSATKCRRGSIQKLYIAGLDDLTSFTLVSGEHGYSNITMVSTKLFYIWTFQPDQAYAKWEANEVENGKDTYNTEVSIYVPQIGASILEQAQELADTCGLVVIAEFYDTGTFNSNSQTTKLVFGYDEIDLKTIGVQAHISGDSGENREAANGVSVVIKGKQSELPYYYDSGTNAIPIS